MTINVLDRPDALDATARSAPFRPGSLWWTPIAWMALAAAVLSTAVVATPVAMAPGSLVWWTLTVVLHAPFGVILVFLFAGLIERVGYAFRGFRPEEPGVIPADMPRVCIQLPMFNEDAVAARVILAAGAIDWPRDRFEVQVLDDSTDAAARAIVDDAVAELRATGVHCTVLRRDDRVGYKAGALEEGRRRTRAAFLMILDADFLPEADLLRRIVPYFYDSHARPLADVAFVQARWGHLNREESALTRAQTLWVDDHHTLQMSWRSAQWGFVNFTGTAGIWRADAIERSGGWRAASLVEDCELSFRALFAGYRTRFVKEVVVSAELPATHRAYRAQQKRWTQGWAQLQRLHARTLSTTYLTGPIRRLHLLYHLAIPCQWPVWGVWMLLLPILVHEGLWFGASASGMGLLVYVAPTLVWLGLASAVATVETARLDGDRTPGVLTRGIFRVFPYAALNTGMLPQQVAAYVEGLRGPLHAEFVRTPKTASMGTSAHAAPRRKGAWRLSGVTTAAEVFFVSYQLGWAAVFANLGLTWPMLLSCAVAICVVTVSVRGARG